LHAICGIGMKGKRCFALKARKKDTPHTICHPATPSLHPRCGTSYQDTKKIHLLPMYMSS